ncbi:hypothetical protein BLOT_002365 [Blomia tropicalis]|nr:hypothetical protein BLOT_002365 [Blomia tropicalis]
MISNGGGGGGGGGGVEAKDVWYYHSPVRFPMSPHRRSIIIKPMFLLSMFSIMVMVLLVFGDDLDLEILKSVVLMPLKVFVMAVDDHSP